MYTLGINAVYHDSAASLVADGRVVAAAEEERFTRIKHGKRPVPFSTWELPFHAIDYCLRQAGIDQAEVDHVAYSFDPALLLGRHRGAATITLPLEPSAHPLPEEWEAAWDPLFLAHIVNAPRHLAGGVPHHLRARFHGAARNGPFRWHWVEHHLAHAVSAFFPSPFPRAAVMTLDGRGERATTTYAVGEGTHLERIGQVDFPHSLGLLYEKVTEHLGFLHSADEYKVMALASFGEPRYLDRFHDAVRLQGDGGYTVEPLCLEEWFGPARRRGEPLEQRHCDLARSLQVVLEETVLALARWLHEATGADDLCLAGGVALNCVLNARLRDDGPFRHIWVQPAAGDAGTALGAALWVDARERGAVERSWRMEHAFLGPEFGDDEIAAFLDGAKLPYRRMDDVAGEVADLLADGKIVGWFQGRMEFGPRALGARSILASPLDPEMQTRLNAIKDREDFRPVAPVVLAEEAATWFRDAAESPFMLFVHEVRPEQANRIPAVRHVDGTARIQTIVRAQHPRYYDLLRAFQARTGVPVLVNTSFNTRGEPIVCTPRDAFECFWASPLDALAIGPFLLEKPER
ncbi:carbamoyltransferase family protein [Sphaerobacter thermophilus]|uniref:Carbamoyltransferase n=1 Tax=Sphaerobacter thermophilus (strain ATCC 49802 / DSM 20745 / KCCM 41009 / NCIMB 13125 / S 6022) TaxID=479434 RepID=D1C9T3_SPHTD|nr:carbamoyltransferase C-terminal domain-containing protein [Sphaerobacter thermophilus]ACZ40576.1 Carbamoyltransferase [Sphaerobacter thermophilus DSM 20745]